MKKVVMTGPTGTIGVALARYLDQKGITVYAIARPGSARLDGIRNLENVHVVECDLSNLTQLSSVLPQQIDVFYHIGWNGVSREARSQVARQTRNIQYTIDAVELAAKLNCKMFIGAGSQAEYGNSEDIISPHTIAKPTTAYGTAKLAAGQLSRLLCDQKGIGHIWARFFSVYGEYNGEDAMIISAIIRFLNGQSFPCTMGEQIWDYLYAEDAARALYLLAQKGIAGKTYCVGYGEGRPLHDYIVCMRDMISKDLQVEFGAVPYGSGPMKLVADISELTQDTGFKPQYTFEKGIAKTIQWVWRQKEKGEVLQ